MTNKPQTPDLTITRSNDLSASAVFFDSVFGTLNGNRTYSLDRMISYSFGPETPMIVRTCPYDGKIASYGNGTMIALAAQDRAQVDAIYAIALKYGATDDGSPGQRGRNFYGGYFRDFDGNKFNICLTS